MTYKRLPTIFLGAVLLAVMAGCGGYPLPIESAHDIESASSSETELVIVTLPLKDWPKLQKFTGLQHFRVAKRMAPVITDEHVKVLAGMEFPKLRDVGLGYCSGLTDEGIAVLAQLPSIIWLQLIGAGITDRGMHILATELPRLEGINVEGCQGVTADGLKSLAESKTITEVGLSLDPLTQEQIEDVISSVPNVALWSIRDLRHKLDLESLRRLGELRHVRIDVVNERNSVTVITDPKPDSQ
jgi:hypothetical protein